MTSPTARSTRRPSPGLLGDAAVVAGMAAARAGVTIRPLDTLAQMQHACRVLDSVWGIAPGAVSEVQPHLLRALESGGNYLVGAYAAASGSDEPALVGASVAFFAEPLGAAMHSHITGVLPGRAGAGVGAAIKWHQRQWGLERGLSRISWTFDPLIARNAFFNVTRLGGWVQTYFVDYYGPMDDGPNRGQPTDRVRVVWDLAGESTLAAQRALLGGAPVARAGAGVGQADGPDAPAHLAAQLAAGAPVLLAPDATGAPARSTTGRVPGPIALIGIPPDIEALRRTDPALALRWRHALRQALALMLADPSWRITGFDRQGWYLLKRDGAGSERAVTVDVGGAR